MTQIDEILMNLYLVGRRIRSRLKQKNHDNMLEVAILRVLFKNKLTITKLASRLSIKISAVSEKINEMENKNLVKKFHEEDGREVYLEPTEIGKIIVKRMIAQMHEKCSDIMEGWSERDKQKLVSLLSKMLN